MGRLAEAAGAWVSCCYAARELLPAPTAWPPTVPVSRPSPGEHQKAVWQHMLCCLRPQQAEIYTAALAAWLPAPGCGVSVMLVLP